MATSLPPKSTGGKKQPTAAPTYVPIQAKARLQLTERDRELLVWVTRHGMVTMEQITKKFFPTKEGRSAAYQRVQKLCAATPPLLQRDLTHYREPSVIRVTKEGARIADIGIGPARLVLSEVHHACGIVDLTELILDQYPNATLITERERRAERYREKRAGLRKSTGRIPDAVFIMPPTAKSGKEQTIAIELDRTARSRVDAEAVIRAYIAERYSSVWWYVRPTRVAAITQLTKRMKVDDFIEVVPWDGV